MKFVKKSVLKLVLVVTDGFANEGAKSDIIRVVLPTASEILSSVLLTVLFNTCVMFVEACVALLVSPAILLRVALTWVTLAVAVCVTLAVSGVEMRNLFKIFVAS